MNKIYKVIYSKVKQCYIVVSELAKSHVKSSHGSNGQQKAALTMSVLLALGAFTFAFGPVNAEAATKTKTDGSNFIGVERTDGTFEDSSYKNYNGGGAEGPQSITIGTAAEAGNSTITIGDRRAGASIGSVYVGQGDIKNPFTDRGGWVTSVGYNSDATGYGSIAIGSNAIAKNDIKQNIELSNASGDLNDNPTIKGASVALGYSASAADGSIAIGSYSVATAAASTETAKFRDNTDSDYKAPSSYVSVGSDTVKRRITNVAAGSDANDVATVGQLAYVEQEAQAKGSWKLTAGKANESTVTAGSTVDFSAGSDGNLSVSKTADSNNVTIGLKKDVTLGAATSGNGGSLDVYRAVADANSDKETNPKGHVYDQLGSHVRIDGSTVSVHYDNGTGNSDARGIVLGVANDSYADSSDSTKTVNSPLGYVYLQDGDNYYYIHGAMNNDTDYQGRLVYNSSKSGYNYIANLEDGISFSGDAVKAGSTAKNTTADTRLDPTAANHTLSITGGAKTDLTTGNIGVVTTPTEYDGTVNNGVKTAGGLSIQLAKDLKGITSIVNGTDGSGAKITLGTSGTTISGGDVSVSGNKITKVGSGLGEDGTYNSVTDAENAANLSDVSKMINNAADSNGKKLGDKANIDASNIGTNLKGSDGTTKAIDDEIRTNENNWGTAIGTGKIADSSAQDASSNGSQQLVTGGTVYNALNQAKNELTNNLTYKAGWGIDIADKTNDDGTVTKNVISLDRNLGTNYGNQAGGMGKVSLAASGENSLVLGTGATIETKDTAHKDQDVEYGATAQDSVTVGGFNNLASGEQAIVNGGSYNVASGYASVVNGGGGIGYNGTHYGNTASGKFSTVTGGAANTASGTYATVNGGQRLTASGVASLAAGGSGNTASGGISLAAGGMSNAAEGDGAAILNGAENTATGYLSTIVGGYKNQTAGYYSSAMGGTGSHTEGIRSVGIGGGSTGLDASDSVAIGNGSMVTVEKGVAIGQSSVTNQAGTISFGHNQGDVKERTVTYKKKDNGSIEYDSNHQPVIDTVTETTYDSAAYNRLVKVADGRDDHDVVVVEQLKNLAAASDASNIGANLSKVPIKDADGNIQYDDSGAMKMQDASDSDKTTNENFWGQAIGTGKITDDAAKGGQQLVTGSTVFNEVRPATNDGKYVKKDQTTGENLSKLDSALQNVDKKAGAHTVLKVEGQSAGTADGEYKGTNLLLHQDTDSETGQVTYDLKLANKVTIGSADDTKVTIDGTKGEVSGLNNTDWSKDKSSDYENSDKAATEAQVQKAYDAAVQEAGTNAAKNDIHVAAGEQSVSNDNKISMNLVDGNGKTQGTVTITDVARASDMGNVSDLHDNLKKTDGTATTVIAAINKVDDKIGDQKYSTSNTSTSGNKYVTDGDSITNAIGKLDGAVQKAADAAATAGKQHSTVSAGSNIDVDGEKQSDGHMDYKVSLKDNISLNSVTTKTTTTDTLTVNNNATIGGVTIKDQTISGLKDTDIKEGSTNAVNGNTIWKELRPESDGSYIKKDSTTAKNLISLDTQVKKTSDLINSDGKTIKIGGSDAATKVDVSGKDGQGRVITGVKTDANDSTSAASVGYVNDMNAANTQQIYHDMNSAYSHVENDISRAAAGSNALAALHPMEFDPDDKAQYALGYGHYRNSNAGAVGVFYQPDENSMFSLGASFGNGDAGINAGVTVKFGPGGSGHHALTKTQMAKVINEQSQEIDTLKKENADKDKRIDALEQKVNEILAKVEKDKA